MPDPVENFVEDPSISEGERRRRIHLVKKWNSRGYDRKNGIASGVSGYLAGVWEGFNASINELASGTKALVSEKLAAPFPIMALPALATPLPAAAPVAFAVAMRLPDQFKFPGQSSTAPYDAPPNWKDMSYRARADYWRKYSNAQREVWNSPDYKGHTSPLSISPTTVGDILASPPIPNASTLVKGPIKKAAVTMAQNVGEAVGETMLRTGDPEQAKLAAKLAGGLSTASTAAGGAINAGRRFIAGGGQKHIEDIVAPRVAAAKELGVEITPTDVNPLMERITRDALKYSPEMLGGADIYRESLRRGGTLDAGMSQFQKLYPGGDPSVDIADEIASRVGQKPVHAPHALAQFGQQIKETAEQRVGKVKEQASETYRALEQAIDAAADPKSKGGTRKIVVGDQQFDLNVQPPKTKYKRERTWDMQGLSSKETKRKLSVPSITMPDEAVVMGFTKPSDVFKARKEASIALDRIMQTSQAHTPAVVEAYGTLDKLKKMEEAIFEQARKTIPGFEAADAASREWYKREVVPFTQIEGRAEGEYYGKGMRRLTDDAGQHVVDEAAPKMVKTSEGLAVMDRLDPGMRDEAKRLLVWDAISRSDGSAAGVKNALVRLKNEYGQLFGPDEIDQVMGGGLLDTLDDISAPAVAASGRPVGPEIGQAKAKTFGNVVSDAAAEARKPPEWINPSAFSNTVSAVLNANRIVKSGDKAKIQGLLDFINHRSRMSKTMISETHSVNAGAAAIAAGAAALDESMASSTGRSAGAVTKVIGGLAALGLLPKLIQTVGPAIGMTTLPNRPLTLEASMDMAYKILNSPQARAAMNTPAMQAYMANLESEEAGQ